MIAIAVNSTSQVMIISDSMLGLTLLLPAKTNLCGSMFAQIVFYNKFLRYSVKV